MGPPLGVGRFGSERCTTKAPFFLILLGGRASAREHSAERIARCQLATHGIRAHAFDHVRPTSNPRPDCREQLQGLLRRPMAGQRPVCPLRRAMSFFRPTPAGKAATARCSTAAADDAGSTDARPMGERGSFGFQRFARPAVANAEPAGSGTTHRLTSPSHLLQHGKNSENLCRPWLSAGTPIRTRNTGSLWAANHDAIARSARPAG